MTRRARHLLLAMAAGLTLATASARAQANPAPAIPQLADRQLEVRGKITELFAERDDPPAKIGPEFNVFVRKREPATESLPATVVSEEEGLDDPNLTPDERILANLIKVIHVAGVVTVSDRQYIVINQVPIPEGGVAIIEYAGVALPLRVEAIGVGEVTVSHGTARMIFVY